jgi:hypothetical protein
MIEIFFGEIFMVNFDPKFPENKGRFYVTPPQHRREVRTSDRINCKALASMSNVCSHVKQSKMTKILLKIK